MRGLERWRWPCVLVTLIATALFVAGTAAARLTRTQRAAMTRAVRGAMVSSYYPGMAVGFSSPKGSFVRAFGIADARTGRLRVTDRFRIAGVTKTLTATIVLQR